MEHTGDPETDAAGSQISGRPPMLLENIDTAFLQDDERRIEHDVDILVRDGQIVEIGRGLSADQTVDCRAKIALPGLINCHTHTPQLFARGWSDDEPLFPWLGSNAEVIARADRDVRRAAGRLSAVLGLQTGTTTVNDMWNTYLVEEFVDVGIRSFTGCALTDGDDSDPSAVQERIETNRSFIAEYGDHPTVHPTVPVHSTYNATESLLRTAHDIAATHDRPFHIHVSETREENERLLAERGTTPTGWLDDLGVLDHRGVLAHAVHLSEVDRERVAASGAGVAHCASANLKLGSGIADIPAMEGIPVGLGTDSAASSNTLNLFREGRTAALAHKLDDPGAMTAQRILDTMTCEAAAVLGVADTLGSLEAGKRADIVLLDAEDPTLHPHVGDQGRLSNLVYSFHGRTDSVIVEGEFVVVDGEATADVDAAIETVQEFADAVARDRPDRT